MRFYVKLCSPDAAQNTGPAVGQYLSTPPKYPLKMANLQGNASQLHSFLHPLAPGVVSAL